MFTKHIALEITCAHMWQSLKMDESQFMGAQDDVLPMSDIINTPLDDAADVAFDMCNVGVEDDVLPGDINNNLYEIMTDCGEEYDCSVDFDIQYEQCLHNYSPAFYHQPKLQGDDQRWTKLFQEEVY